jgi:hypothetical protein
MYKKRNPIKYKVFLVRITTELIIKKVLTAKKITTTYKIEYHEPGYNLKKCLILLANLKLLSKYYRKSHSQRTND